MARLVARNSSGSAHWIACDEHLGVLGASSFEHIAIDNGLYYTVSRYAENVADSGAITVLIKVPSSGVESALLGGTAKAGGDAKLEVYAQPTILGNGTELSTLQVNQLSSNTPNLQAFHTPSISNDGTIAFTTFIPGGHGGVSVGGGGEFQRLNAAPNRNFLIKLTNIAGNAQTMSLNLNWIEAVP